MTRMAKQKVDQRYNQALKNATFKLHNPKTPESTDKEVLEVRFNFWWYLVALEDFGFVDSEDVNKYMLNFDIALSKEC